MHHGQALVAILEREQPGDGDNVERLQEFGRLELGDAHAEPALRAISFLADNRDHEEEQSEQ